MSKRGPKEKIYPVEEIKEIIYECIEVNNINGVVKYSDIYPFALEKYKVNKFPYNLSEDYWRKKERQGTIILKEINDVIEDTIVEDETDKIIKTAPAVHRILPNIKDSTKKQLINTLYINEVKATQFKKENEILEKRLDTIEIKSLEKDEKIKDLSNYKEKFQNIFFQAMEYSVQGDFPFPNLMTTGKSRSKPVNRLFETMFSDNPTLAYDFEQYLKNRNDNVTNIETKNPGIQKKTAADEFYF